MRAWYVYRFPTKEFLFNMHNTPYSLDCSAILHMEQFNCNWIHLDDCNDDEGFDFVTVQVLSQKQYSLKYTSLIFYSYRYTSTVRPLNFLGK